MAKSRKMTLALAVASVAALQLGGFSQAATPDYWRTSAGSTAWATAGNWSSTGAGGASGSAPISDLTSTIAVFDSATTYAFQPSTGAVSIAGLQDGDGTTSTAALTVTGNAAFVIGGSGVLMMANSGTMTLATGAKLGASQNWENDSSSLFTVSGTVTNTANTTPFTLTLNGSGSGGTTFSGIVSNGGTTGTTAILVNTTGGTTKFTANNTFTGGLTITKGTVLGTGNNAGTFGGATNTITLGDTAVDSAGVSFGYTGTATIANNFTLNTGTSGTISISDSTSSHTYSGTIGLTNALTVDNTTAGKTTTFSNTITGSSTLTKGTGVGQVTISGASSALSGLVVVNGGTLQFAQTAGLASSTGVTVNNGGTLAVNAGGSGEYTTSLAAGSLALGTIGSLLSSVTWNAGSALGIDTTTPGSLTIGAAIGGTQGLTKLGTGALILTGTQTYAGLTTASAGTLQLLALTSGGANLASGSNLTTAAAGTFDLNGNDQTVGLLSNAGTVTNSNVTSKTLTIGNGSTGAGSFTGAMNVIWNQGATSSAITGSFTNTGNITLNSNGSNTTIGITTANNVGTISNNGASTGTTTITTVGSNVTGVTESSLTSQLTLTGLTVNSGGTTLTNSGSSKALSVTSAAGSGNLIIVNNGTAAGSITLGGANNTGTITITGTGSGGTTAVTGAIGAGVSSVTQDSSCWLVLSVSNSFTGGLLLKSGTVQIKAGGSLGTGTFKLGDTTGSTAVTFDSQTASLTITNAMNINQNVTFTATQSLTQSTGAISIATANPTITVTSAGNGLTLGGVVTDSGNGLTKAGLGILSLTGANGSTYTGTTVINAGTLGFGTGGLGNGSATITLGGGTLQYSASPANTQDVSSRLRTSGAAALNIDVNGNSVLFGTTLVAANIAGSGGLTLTSTTAGGMLTLTGTQTYAGSTAVTSGTLKLATSASIPGNILTVGAGGVFDLNGNTESAAIGSTNAGTFTSSSATGNLTINSQGAVGAGNYTGTMNLIWNNDTTNGTITGSVLTTGNLTLNANATGGNKTEIVTLANNAGTITNSGGGTGTATVTTVGSSVTGITESSTTSALTIGTLNVNGVSGTTLTNSSGTQVLKVSNSVAGSGALILNNNSSTALGITLTGGANNAGTITNSGSGTGASSVTIDGIIGTSVQGVIQNSAASMLSFTTAVNTYTSGLSIKAGTASGTLANSFGADANVITLGDGTVNASATLLSTANALTHANPITVTSVSAGTLTIEGQTNSQTFSGNIALGNALSLLNLTAAKTTTFSGTITGSSTITVPSTNLGTVALTGANGSSFTGPVGINGGTLTFTNHALGDGNGAITFGGGTLQYSASPANSQDISSRIATTSSPIAIDTNGNTVSFGSALDNTHSGGLTVTSTAANGVLVLSTASTYTGATTLNSGALQLTNAGAIPSTSTLSLASGVTLQLRGNSDTTFSSAGITLPAAAAATYTISADNITSGVTGKTLTLQGTITAPAISNSATQTFNLSSANGYKLVLGDFNLSNLGTNVPINVNISGTATIGFMTMGPIGSASSTVTFDGGGNITWGGMQGGKSQSFTVQNSTTVTLNGHAFGNNNATVATVKSGGTLIFGPSCVSGTFMQNFANGLALSGGATIDNQSGNTLNYTSNSNQSWSGNFTFGSANTSGALNITGMTTAILTVSNTPTVTIANANYGLSVNGVVSGTGGFTKSGPGTLTFTNAVSTYTGTTAVNLGTLALGSGGTGSLGGTDVTVGNSTMTPGVSGNATLQINGNYTIGTALLGSLTVVGGDGSTVGQGTVSMVDGTINALTLANNASTPTTFTIGSNTNGSNSVLNMEFGATADQISLAATAKVSVGTSTTKNVVNLTYLGGLTGTTQTLINAPGGLAAGSFSNFQLGLTSTTTGNFKGYQLALNATATALQLTETANATPATAYFKGAIDANWNTFTGGNANNTNWATTSTGTTDPNQVPGANAGTTDVHFYTTNATTGNLATTLGQNFAIQTLTVDGGSLPVSIAPGGGTLTITPTSASTGISLPTGAGTLTISAPVAMGANQTWTVTDAANTLTVSGVVSGAFNLSTAGAGTVVLSGNSTYTGTTTISTGKLKLGAAGSGANTPLGTIAGGTTVSAGAALDLNGFTLATAEPLTLNGTGISSGGALTNSSATAATYSGLLTLGSDSSIVASSGNIVISNTGTITGAANLTLDGAATGSSIASIIGTGAGSVTKTGAGTWTITGANTFTGGVTLSSGTLDINVAGAAGSNGPLGNGGTFTINGGTIGNTSGSAKILLNVNPVTLGGDFAFSTLGSTSASSLTLPGAVSVSASTTITANGTSTLQLTAPTLSASSSGLKTITIAGTGNVTIGAVPTTGSVISDGSGQVGFAMTSTGTLTLGGANSFTGDIVVKAGTLTDIGSSAGGTTSFGAGTIKLGDTAAGNASVALSLTAHGSFLTISNPITVQSGNSGTKTIDNVGGNFIQTLGGLLTLNDDVTIKYSGTVGGATTLGANTASAAITGAGNIFFYSNSSSGVAMTISGTNPGFTGGVTVETGVAKVSNVNALSASNVVAVASGATFDLLSSTNGNNYTIAGLKDVSAAGGTATNSNTKTATLTLGGNGTYSFSGVVTATTPADLALTVALTGSGVQTLGGANTYTGATNVTSGTLKAGVTSVANVSGAFGNNSALTLANTAGATLDLNGFDTQIGSLTGGGATGGNVTLGSATLTIGGNNTSPAAYAGDISGAGAVTKIGTGTLTLSGGNSYSGATLISAGKFVVGANASSGSAGALGNATSVVTLGDANTTTNNSSPSLLIGGAFTVGRGVTIANQATSGTFTLGGNTDDASTFSGLVTLNQPVTLSSAALTGSNAVTFSGDITGNQNLTVVGTGTGSAGVVNFSTNKSYTGSTTVSSGTLAVNGTLASTTVNVNSGGTFTVTSTGAVSASTALTANGTANFNNAAQTLASLSGSGNVTLNATALTVSSGGAQAPALTLTTNGGTVSLSGTNSLGTIQDTSASVSSYAGTTTVAASGNLMANTIRQGTLALGNNVNVTLNESSVGPSGTLADGWPSGSDNAVSIIRNITFGTSAKLDVTNNDIIFDNGMTAATLEGLVRKGYNGGAWNGTDAGGSIVSSDASLRNIFTLLVLDNATAGFTTFDGVSVGSTAVIMKFTHQADLNGDGVVTGTGANNDLSLFASYYAAYNVDNGTSTQRAVTHAQGDMDFDGQLTFNDAQLFTLYYNEGLAHLPEPTSLAFLALGAAGLLARKRR